MFLRRFYVLAFSLLLPLAALFGQTPGQLVNIYADSLQNKLIDGKEVMVLIGNVKFSQGMISGSADKATQYKSENKVILEGNVEITQDVMLLKAPNVEYNGSTSTSKAENGVYLSDRDASVTARKGYYDLNLQRADFEGNVKANQAGTFISSDKLTYFRTSQTTYAKGNVEVLSDSGKLKANELTNVRLTGETIANGNVSLTNDTSELYCENFYDSKSSGLTTASRNVSLYDRKNNSWLLADTLARLRDSSLINVPISPYLLLLDTTKTVDSLTGITITRIDTLFITAKSMVAKTGDSSAFYAHDSVRIFRLNFSGIGSALTYRNATGDMILHGRGRQRVWYDSTELDCDSLVMKTVNKKIDKIHTFGKPFLTSPYEDTTVKERINQLSSQRMILTVTQDTVRNLLAIDNAISLYFVSSDGKPSGINRATGDSLRVDFEKNQPKGITVLHETEGEYIPERFVKHRGGAYRLSTFERHIELRPKREDFHITLPTIVTEIKQQ